jgi:hypothetical protein
MLQRSAGVKLSSFCSAGSIYCPYILKIHKKVEKTRIQSVPEDAWILNK